MKKVVITAGPIPAKLDSVKVVTNMFKGGLAAKTAEALSEYFDVEVVKWKGTNLNLPSYVKVINVSDVIDYMDTVLSIDADAYILAAAVANLMPLNPWPGKFPSHEYKVGDEFDVKFTIAPRLIDQIKKARPRSTLIGYKLFDGSEEDLIKAGFHTMRDSLSNVVFCNHPATAKSEKIALTADGATIPMSFDEHIEFMIRTISLEWYRTKITQEKIDKSAWEKAERLLKIVSRRAFTGGELSFGTLAVRAENGFITTTRGKRETGLCQVFDVDKTTRVVTASAKATMNAPMLHRLLNSFPSYTPHYVLHAHKQLPGERTFDYVFPGTTEEDGIEDPHYMRVFNVDHHGYYATLDTEEDLNDWLEHHHPEN